MGSTKVKVPPPPPVPEPTAEQIQIQKLQFETLKRQIAEQDRLAPIFDQQIRAIQGRIDASEGLEKDRLAFERDQLEIARQAQRDQRAIEPFILQNFELTREPGGNLRRMTEDEILASLSPIGRQQREITQLELTRRQQALKGELPLSEAGQAQKAEEFKVFKEAMARSGNPITGDDPSTATAETTAGIRSLAAFNQRFGLLEEAERRGELTEGNQAILGRLGLTEDIAAKRASGLLMIPTAATALAAGTGGLFPRAQTQLPLIRPDFIGSLSAFPSVLQPFQFQQGLQFQSGQTQAERLFQANLASLQAKTSMVGAGLGALGTIGGIGVAKLISSSTVKKDIQLATLKEEKEALKMVENLDTYTYRYKNESSDKPKRMGLMADNAPREIVTPDRAGLDIGRVIGILIGATRALARRK